MTRESLRQCSIRLFAAIILLGLAGVPAAAQSESASIVGIVVDESGAILPGVTVTASSPSLQIAAVTDVSNERGEYRLAPWRSGRTKSSIRYPDFRECDARTSG